jgi:hypothetical protein
VSIPTRTPCSSKTGPPSIPACNHEDQGIHQEISNMITLQKPNNSRHSLVKKFLLLMDPPHKPLNGIRACHTQRKGIGLELYAVNITNKDKAW